MDLINYYYNRLFIIVTYEIFSPTRYTSLKLLPGGFFSAEVQLLLPKPVSEVFFVSNFFFFCDPDLVFGF